METALIIKSHLEGLFDVPFDIRQDSSYPDVCFTICPHSECAELFCVKIKFKNQIRLIIEVYPEKNSAFAIADMSSASSEKKNEFAEYARLLLMKQPNVTFKINGILCRLDSPEEWPGSWNGFELRLTKSPICKENEALDIIGVTKKWATIVIGMFLSLLNVESGDDRFLEGGVSRVYTNKYERNPANRKMCLSSNGFVCQICGFDFERTYGKIGHHFIHVHHIVPVSSYGSEKQIDPEKDLIPVCPNCHAMLHKKEPPFLPDEIKSMIKR